MHNFFELLNLEELFSIDQNLLEEKYFDSLGKYHPDRAPMDKRAQYAAMSSLINSAYEALKDDFTRAAHILEIHGINITSDSTAPKLSLDILEEILEMQEAIEDPSQKDHAIQTAKTQKEAIIFELKDLFDQKEYKKAAQKALYLKYLLKILG